MKCVLAHPDSIVSKIFNFEYLFLKNVSNFCIYIIYLRREAAERILDIFVELVVRKMGLGSYEGDAFTAYPDYKLVSLVLDYTLKQTWPDLQVPTLEVSTFLD